MSNDLCFPLRSAPSLPRRVSGCRRHAVLPEALEGRRLMAVTAGAGDPVSLPDNPAGTMFVDVGALAPLTDVTGTTAWAPDAGFSGGKRVRGKLSVEGTEDDAIFASRRQGDFTYALPLADGEYTVSLLFVDTVKKAGKRVFHVYAEGGVLEQDLDVVARAGRRTALTVTHDVTVSGGTLDLAFIGVHGKAVLSGISVAPAAPDAAPPATGGGGESGGTAAKPPAARNPAELKWAAGPKAPAPRVEAGGIQVGDKLYMWGGFTGGDNYEAQDRMDVLDLATLTWSPRRPSPAPPTHAALATDGRYIYAAGGQYGGGIPGRPSSDVWRYDTVDDVWTKGVLPDLPEARYGGAMSLVDNKLYFFAGNRPDRVTVAHDLWVLDLNNADAGWATKAPLPKGLSGDHISAAVVNGIIYAVGGEHGHAATEDDDAPYIQHDLLMAYDPVADAWTRRADLPQAISHAESGTLVVNGKIVVLGGQIDDIKVTAETRVYDPVTNVWSLLTALPEDRKGGVAGYFDGKLFYTGGQRDGDFHVATNTWVGTLTGL
jgi:N-acetylneuraminic acid mutarotase